MPRGLIVVGALLASLSISSCSEPPPTAPSIRASRGITPMCQLGCTETDPNPTAPGVFLGSGVVPDDCGIYTDSDQDGLGDFCEKQLSFAFSPELYHWQFDHVGREPYWVARPTPSGGVRLGYLLSYYRDEGSNHWLCTGQPFWIDPSCFGHNGDRESIFLDVYYDWDTQHWVLENGWLSRHDEFFQHPRGSDSYPTQFIYPSHPGSYPRVYVSEGKHANYATKTGCNGGGQYGTDTCAQVNTATRLEWSSLWNLGSRTTHSGDQDCKLSRNPSFEYYGSGRYECYWTGVDFRGWIPTSVGGAVAGSYSPVLQAMGF